MIDNTGDDSDNASTIVEYGDSDREDFEAYQDTPQNHAAVEEDTFLTLCFPGDTSLPPNEGPGANPNDPTVRGPQDGGQGENIAKDGSKSTPSVPSRPELKRKPSGELVDDRKKSKGGSEDKED